VTTLIFSKLLLGRRNRLCIIYLVGNELRQACRSKDIKINDGGMGRHLHACREIYIFVISKYSFCSARGLSAFFLKLSIVDVDGWEGGGREG
jgi:hypothetical protein